MEFERKQIEERVKAVENRRANNKSEKEKVAMYKRFIIFCLKFDFKRTNYESVAAFIVAHAMANDSCKTCAQVASKLRVYHNNRNLQFLSSFEEQKLKSFIDELRLENVEEVHRMMPFTSEIISTVTAELNMDVEKDRVLALAIHLGHDGLLRSKEILWRDKQIEKGPEVRNFSFGNNSNDVMYSIPRTKTHRKGAAVNITIPSVGTGTNAYSLLKLHLKKSDLNGKPTSQLFPSYATTAWLRRQLKKLATKYNIDPSVVGNHVLRAGGATDLFNSNLPTWVIQKYGRWKSNAVLIYQRDEHHVMRMVQKGFEAATVNNSSLFKDMKRKIARMRVE